MRTALERRQRHRRNGNGNGNGHGSGTRTVSGIAVAIPLFLFGTFLLVGMVGFVVAVSAYSVYSQGLGDPKELLDNLAFEQPNLVYDSTGNAERARFGQTNRP